MKIEASVKILLGVVLGVIIGAVGFYIIAKTNQLCYKNDPSQGPILDFLCRDKIKQLNSCNTKLKDSNSKLQDSNMKLKDSNTKLDICNSKYPSSPRLLVIQEYRLPSSGDIKCHVDTNKLPTTLIYYDKDKNIICELNYQTAQIETNIPYYIQPFPSFVSCALKESNGVIVANTELQEIYGVIPKCYLTVRLDKPAGLVNADCMIYYYQPAYKYEIGFYDTKPDRSDTRTVATRPLGNVNKDGIYTIVISFGEAGKYFRILIKDNNDTIVQVSYLCEYSTIDNASIIN